MRQVMDALRIVGAAICMPLLFVACTEATFLEAPRGETVSLPPLSLALDSLTVHANEISQVGVVASLGPDFPRDGLVRFSTTLGGFVDSTGTMARSIEVTAIDGRATTLFVAGTMSGIAVLQARAGSETQTHSLSLLVAPPDSIAVFTDRVSVPADGKTEVALTARLGRREGVVSRAISVEFIAVDSVSQAPIPGFRALALSDSTGAATAKVASTIPGTFYFQALAGSVASGRILTRFTKPQE